jgi:hypothetical protein
MQKPVGRESNGYDEIKGNMDSATCNHQSKPCRLAPSQSALQIHVD